MQKKGAIEMSMTTIIIVVIGVTLLVLGIRFVVSTMSGITEQQEGIQAMSEQKLAEMFGQSEKALSLPKAKLEIDQGDTGSVTVYVRNPSSETLTLKYKVNLDSSPSGMDRAVDWVTWTKSGRPTASGKGYEDTLSIDVPNTAKVGNYRFTMEIDCTGISNEDLCVDGTSMAFEVLTVTVKGT
ncbi:MAG: hypothetical protein KJ955_08270 [Nanoarchaeota archaeon]|nr:hypothetical protein [Nanoarchaeota archaeon]